MARPYKSLSLRYSIIWQRRRLRSHRSLSESLFAGNFIVMIMNFLNLRKYLIKNQIWIGNFGLKCLIVLFRFSSAPPKYLSQNCHPNCPPGPMQNAMGKVPSQSIGGPSFIHKQIYATPAAALRHNNSASFRYKLCNTYFVINLYLWLTCSIFMRAVTWLLPGLLGWRHQ